MMNRLFATTATAALFALSLGGGTANADTQQYRPVDLDKSIVWVAVTWDGTVTVPFTDGTTEDKHASVQSFCTGWFVSTTGDIATLDEVDGECSQGWTGGDLQSQPGGRGRQVHVARLGDSVPPQQGVAEMIEQAGELRRVPVDDF